MITPPPIAADKHIQGGSAILKRQAACAFQAFADIRLRARPIRLRKLGFDALERGSLLHRALELTWRNLQDSHKLIAMPADRLEKMIAKTVSYSLQEWLEQHPQDDIQHYIELEQTRLTTTILRWLAYEARRAPFTVVATEARYQATWQQLNIKLTIDRIDELDNGEKVIIDYKSNVPTVQSWLGERPDEPQLPLYCLTSDYGVAGIAFAQVRSDEMRFKGITCEQDYLPDTKSAEQILKTDNAWCVLTSGWQQHLSKLAADFAMGDARVNPKHPVQTCQFCELNSLCRIHTPALEICHE